MKWSNLLYLERLDRAVLRLGKSTTLLVAAETMDMQLTLGDVGNVIVLKVKNTLGVLDYRRGIGGDEEFDRLREAVLRHERTGLRAEHAGARRGNEEATRRRRRGCHCMKSVQSKLQDVIQTYKYWRSWNRYQDRRIRHRRNQP